MLDKEFVPYQESLELVGLGYDEPVEFFKDSSEEIFDMRTPNDAPCILWQKAFRWFREKYELHHLDLLSLLFLEQKMNYEEAELVCLRKLIEIVKEK